MSIGLYVLFYNLLGDIYEIENKRFTGGQRPHAKANF